MSGSSRWRAEYSNDALAGVAVHPLHLYMKERKKERKKKLVALLLVVHMYVPLYVHIIMYVVSTLERATYVSIK